MLFIERCSTRFSMFVSGVSSSISVRVKLNLQEWLAPLIPSVVVVGLIFSRINGIN